IRERLLNAFPQWAYRGEETGRGGDPSSDFLWLVDPNDGTSDYLKGHRGSAVSIGLLHKQVPVLGVVYAFGYPDDEGDLIAWAEGSPLSRKGVPLQVNLSSLTLDESNPPPVTFVSAKADQN